MVQKDRGAKFKLGPDQPRTTTSSKLITRKVRNSDTTRPRIPATKVSMNNMRKKKSSMSAIMEKNAKTVPLAPTPHTARILKYTQYPGFTYTKGILRCTLGTVRLTTLFIF